MHVLEQGETCYAGDESCFSYETVVKCIICCVFLMEHNINKLSAAMMDLLTDHITSNLWTRPLKNMKRDELG